MSVIKGQNLRISVGGEYLAFSTSCTVHVSATLEDSSTKDSTNSWQEQEITGMAWDLSADALYSVDEDATGMNGVDALDLILSQQEVDVEFTQTTGAKNRESVATPVKYTGKALVNDISISAQNRQNATYTIQAQGNGELKKTTAA